MVEVDRGAVFNVFRTRGAFECHTEFFHHTRTCRIILKADAVDSFKVEFIETIIDHSICGLGHEAMVPLADPAPVTYFRTQVSCVDFIKADSTNDIIRVFVKSGKGHGFLHCIGTVDIPYPVRGIFEGVGMRYFEGGRGDVRMVDGIDKRGFIAGLKAFEDQSRGFEDDVHLIDHMVNIA